MNKDLNKIKIEDATLSKIIYDSYLKYPRKYLLEKNKKPITQPTFLSYLRKITGLPEINTDIMRSSYINYFYANNDKTMKEKEKLANVMRHSVLTAQCNYLKIDKKKPQTEKKEDKTITSTERKREDILKEIQKLQDELKLLNLKNDEETITPIDKAYIKKGVMYYIL